MEGTVMDKKKLILFCILFLCLIGLGGLLWVHRRVIRAWITGEPMPEPPAWHFWCKKK